MSGYIMIVNTSFDLYVDLFKMESCYSGCRHAEDEYAALITGKKKKLSTLSGRAVQITV